MPKKKGAKKKTKAGKPERKAGLSHEDKLTRASHEVALLQAELAERREEARRAAYKASQAHGELEAKHVELEGEHETTRDITTGIRIGYSLNVSMNSLSYHVDLTRQYKLMQSQLMAKILDLQETCRILTDERDTAKGLLDEVKEQASRSLREKDDIIAQLTQRIESMETAYESVLNEALDTMASRVEQARDKWEAESYVLQQKNKDVLMEFGLSHAAM
eukprot:TRINITY_DN9321_c0_g1_i2.p1 TRINITY_DN9321_c0_g1~~TRINITY_DN9321_c0_g1_i2.p1  ORF type:complete len:219 (+),score=37.35 TRINITY_DN9321_c0_g1_i2:57-713(+)